MPITGWDRRRGRRGKFFTTENTEDTELVSFLSLLRVLRVLRGEQPLSSAMCRASLRIPPSGFYNHPLDRVMNPAEPRPAINPWIVTAAVMLATFMEILDTTVVNVAVPHIAGNMGATVEEGTWVVTSYLVSNAIILPMSGWLANRFGRRRILLSCVMGRSEEHTSELQSRGHLVCRLLL